MTVPINPAASDRELLVQLLMLVDAGFTDLRERLTAMSAQADATAAAVNAENAKIETLLGLVQPALDGLRAANAALQTQIDALKAGDSADAVTLQAAADASVAETAKVQAAIDALTPPPPTP